jgi:hypothetical protein
VVAHPAHGRYEAVVIDNQGLRRGSPGPERRGIRDTRNHLPGLAVVGDLRRRNVLPRPHPGAITLRFPVSAGLRIVHVPTIDSAITRAFATSACRRALATGDRIASPSPLLMQGNAIPATTFVPAALGGACHHARRSR